MSHESEVSIGLHAWSITSITRINPRAADSVKNILQYRHISEATVREIASDKPGLAVCRWLPRAIIRGW